MNQVEQELIEKMIKIYNPNGYDWMGFPITKNNKLTYHHIQMKKDDGQTILENGALLTKSAHRLLNILKTKNSDLYDEWQWLFYAINSSLTQPSYAYIEMMNELREQTTDTIYSKEKRLR